MDYLALARKWRPQTFEELTGQDHVRQTLRNALSGGRIAHAFLFTGSRGVGKTSAARILAKALNCESRQGEEPCNTCRSCHDITQGSSVDVSEIDGASNTGVDDVRALKESIRFLPAISPYKVIIIDEVHMLSTNAFNALLKTLEEPPAHVKFIFATTEPHKVPITVLSRCQRFDFKRIPLRQLVERLRTIAASEEVVISEPLLTAVAKKGDGSLRDALTSLDQLLAVCGPEIDASTAEALLGTVDRALLLSAAQALLSKDRAAALQVVSKAESYGVSMRQFCGALIDLFRSITIASCVPDPADLLELSDHELAEISELATRAHTTDLQRHLTLLLKAETEMANTGQQRVILELAFIKMATLAPAIPVNELLKRLTALKQN